MVWCGTFKILGNRVKKSHHHVATDEPVVHIQSKSPQLPPLCHFPADTNLHVLLLPSHYSCCSRPQMQLPAQHRWPVQASAAILPNTSSHTHTHIHTTKVPTFTAIKAHLSTSKPLPYASHSSSSPVHRCWMLFIVGIYLPACSAVCVYGCECCWACSPPRPALRRGDCVSDSFFSNPHPPPPPRARL